VSGPAEICRITERCQSITEAMGKATEEFLDASRDGDWQRAENARNLALAYHESWFDQMSTLYHLKPMHRRDEQT